jgi:putative heme-binding domain-containing protein
VLRLAREGWTTDLRKRYFAWFHRRPRYGYSPAFLASFRDVGQKPATGMAFDSFLRTIRQQAVVPLPDAEKGELAAWITGAALTNAATAATLPPAATAKPRPARTFVKAWKTDDLAARIATLSGTPARGRVIYDEAQCAVCHRFAGEGGAVGPDLTGAGTRYSRADLLRSLVEPSAVISEQYQAHVLTRKNGETLSGRITGESATVLAVLVDPINGVTLDVPKSDIKSREASRVSPMPEGLLNPFTPEDIADLLAYLQAP